MGIRRLISDLKELRASVADLVAIDEVAEEAASYDLTVATSSFSRRTKAVVDDKLTFSATLMRAGEVEGANRLIEEVEAQVRDEEAALIERVNEVRVARAVRRERITRLRLAKTFAIATIGASLMTFSAMGISLASMLSERAQADEADAWVGALPSEAQSESTRTHSAPSKERAVRKVHIGSMTVALTQRQLEVYRDITAGDTTDLRTFLLSLPANVVAQVKGVLADATADVPAETAEALFVDESQAARRKAARAKRAAEAAQAEEEAAAAEPQAEETESPEADDEGNDEGNEDDGKKKKDQPQDNGEESPFPFDGSDL